jgi:3-hydroxybutyryl-CoA dehydrogenase
LGEHGGDVVTGVARAAVLGAGTMGREIALVLVRSAYDVSLWSRSESTSADSAAWLAERIGPDDGTIRVVPTPEDAVADADAVVETVVEDLGVKHDLLRRVERVAPATAVLTTNTSSIPITELASALANPERLVGLHWFHPASATALVEVVSGRDTSADAAAGARGIAERASRDVVDVRVDVPGFVINRLQYAIMREAMALVEAGVSLPDDIDRAMTSLLGPRWSAVGLFAAMDLAGLDTVARVGGVIFPSLDASASVPAAVTARVAAGDLGQKSGRGFLTWDDARRTAVADRRARVAAALHTAQPGAHPTD